MSHLRRSIERFRANPASPRYATTAIITVITMVVVIGATVVWVFDRKDYPTFGDALWFALQTVTTVGYGDATPTSGLGKGVAAVVMLAAIGLITVVTAVITSAFVEAARGAATRAQAEPVDTAALARLESSMTDIADRLTRLESALAATPTPSEHPDDS